MLQTRHAYPITENNAHLLSLISGKSADLLNTKIGWYATFSESRFPRWQLVQKKKQIEEDGFTIDTTSYP